MGFIGEVLVVVGVGGGVVDRIKWNLGSFELVFGRFRLYTRWAFRAGGVDGGRDDGDFGCGVSHGVEFKSEARRNYYFFHLIFLD